MFKRFYFLGLILALFFNSSCKQESASPAKSLEDTLDDNWIAGKAEYLGSPYVTAGNRLYMVGHQDGSFPELGWHITGEMGGIWNHPIKLMDGFRAQLSENGNTAQLDAAFEFRNYPMANSHHFELGEMGLSVDRFQFVPDNTEGMVVQFVIQNQQESARDLKFQFTGDVDLMPTWLAERQNITDGKDESAFDPGYDAWIVNDSRNEWSVMYGSDRVSAQQGEAKSDYKGNGISNTLDYDLQIAAGGRELITFFIAGSYTSESQTKNTFQELQQGYFKMLEAKKNRYEEIAEQTKLSIPDERLSQTFEWLKYNADWLIRDIPGIGSGFGAGIPDYPWWFGVDSEYSLRGYMAIGMEDVVDRSLNFLDSISMATNGNGRIVHEVSTNGVVFNTGNINETPQFASIVWEVYKWKGDRAYLEKYFPTVQAGLEWLMSEKDLDGNLFPDGFGMMEIHGLDSEMIDVAAYTQRAFADAASMARELGKTDLASEYQDQADAMARKINEDFWSEEFESYADFIGTDEQALRLIEDAIVRADTLDKPWAVEELEQTRELILANPSPTPRPFVLHHNWVVNTPMEMKIADPEKARLALNTARKFINPFGVFVTGIDRDKSALRDDGSFAGSKVFSYTGAVMTLPTGVQAVAENNYGRPEHALDYLMRMTNSFSYALPGSMYEVSPDYGMIVQAWNIYSFAVPIVHQFFGIDPMAAEKTIRIRPQMPNSWSSASLENVQVADNNISVYFEDKDGDIFLNVTQSNPDWTIVLEWPEEKEDAGVTHGFGVIEASGETEDINEILTLTTQGKEIYMTLDRVSYHHDDH
ncbi:glycogen debranching protein [Aureitalea marina]|uniref:Glycogen debranching protein n=1 Tax=Aureitalea marina TaxID=930804 RepID=A0A2S7KLP2_9FLAO|nr:glycogen debranching protein [Aureitalea marina]PQB03537.1 glycogen debranching protein [Aureitalea marina]